MQTQLVCVPTLDWEAVRKPHFQSSIHRAVDSRYAILRATMDGISAIVAPAGEVVAERDHYKEGPGFIIAEVALSSEVTLFSRFGHWPALAAAIYFLMYVILLRGWKSI